MATETHHQALGYALLVYMTVMIAVVTLVPFDFSFPQKIRITLHGNLFDVCANIVLFIPLGFFFQVAHKHVGLKSLLGALCFGLVISCIVETGQLFLPSRFSSVVDVITNGMGALLGAAASVWQRRTVRQGRMSDRFGFGLPLVSSLYLLIPLLWLGGISMGNEIHRLGLIITVGFFGGGIVSSAVANRFRHHLKRPGFAVFGYATGWFFIGALPAMAIFPLAASACGLIVGLAARLSYRIWCQPFASDRRFELPTLKRLLPIYLAYILLLSVWPTTIPLGAWSGHAGFQALDQTSRVLFVARFVEMIAAFTLLGYLAAELSGRRKTTVSGAWKRVFFQMAVAASLITSVRNYCSAPLYIFVEAVAFTAAAMYGAMIYRLQLAAVSRRGKRTEGKKGRGD